MILQGAGTWIGRWTRRQQRAVRRLSERTPLRIKLITALLALVTIALGAIGVASVYVLHSYLTTQSDNALKDTFSSFDTGYPASKPPGYLYQIYGVQNQFVGIQLPGRQLVWAFGEMPGIGNPRQPQQAPPALPVNAGWAGNRQTLVTVPAQSGSHTWRVIAENYTYQAVSSTGSVQQVTGTLVVGTDLGNLNATVRRIAYFDMIVGGVIVVVLALVGVAVVRANLRPLDEIEETAEAIADGHLDRRVPERDPRTEIGRLGRSLNSMLSQIESAFHAREESEAAAHRSEERMRRFIADAGHELRTPLTAIRGFAEYYRQRGGLVPHWDRDEQAKAATSATRQSSILKGGRVPPGEEEPAESPGTGSPPATWTGSCSGWRRKPPGWACSSRTCCCWPGWTSSGRWPGSRSTCSRWRATRCTMPGSSPRPGPSICRCRPARRSWSSATSRGCDRSSET